MGELEKYILSHVDAEPDWLAKINRQTHVKLLHPRMLSGHLQGRILKMLVRMINPLHVLEIGTYTGYSAICLAEGLLRPEGKIYTVEIDDEMEDFIRNSLNGSEFKDKIDWRIGDAKEIIPTFDDAFFELAFIDADKRFYWEHFNLLLPKIKQGGFIIADNTLWGGKVVEETASNDYQTKGILEFNEKLAHDRRVEKVILPVRDGLTIIRKK